MKIVSSKDMKRNKDFAPSGIFPFKYSEPIDRSVFKKDVHEKILAANIIKRHKMEIKKAFGKIKGAPLNIPSLTTGVSRHFTT